MQLFRASGEVKQCAFNGTITIRDKYEVSLLGQIADDRLWITTVDRKRYFSSRLAILQIALEVVAENDVVRRYLLEGYYPRFFLSIDGINLQELILSDDGVLEVMNETDLPLKRSVIPVTDSLFQKGLLLFVRIFFLAIIVQIVIHFMM